MLSAPKSEKTYYEILSIAPDASTDDIKAAYRKLALKYHSDKNLGDDEQMKKINLAYETLSDSERRKLYDKQHLELSQSELAFSIVDSTLYQEDSASNSL